LFRPGLIESHTVMEKEENVEQPTSSVNETSSDQVSESSNSTNNNTTKTKKSNKKEELKEDRIDIVSDAPIDEETMKRFKTAIGKGNKATDAKFVVNQVGKTEILNKDNLRLQSTLYFKGCKDCEYTIDSKCVKVLIESCVNTKIHFNGAVTTSVVELWKSEDMTVWIGSKIQTFQVDMSNKVSLNFSRRDHIHSVVWAGVHDLAISIPNGAGGRETLNTGFPQMQQTFPDIKEDYDQFIVRILEGKLVSEQVVRLENGFPTTEREAKEFDEREARNKKAADRHIKKLVKAVEIKHSTTKKVGRNDPCTCGSGQKYKKCCGGK